MVIVPVLAVLGISGVLILKQPDMGTALVLSCIAFGILFMGGVPMAPIIKVLGVFAGLAVVVGLADPYRRDRILSFLNPGAHKSGTGYQVWQSLIGLGSGHVFGLGLGGGRQKWGILPNAHTDFIFSVVGEELGPGRRRRAPAGLFFALAWFGLRAATRAPDRFGSLLAVGITTWITSQAVINIGAVIGVLPVTGIPLPFISFGGSSLVITMAAVGILINIASHERRGPDRDGPAAATLPGRERDAVRPGGRGWHRRPPPAGPGHRRGAGRARGTTVTPSSSWARRAARTASPWPDGASRSPCCPDGASSAASAPRPGRPTSARWPAWPWPRSGASAWWAGPSPGWWSRSAGTPAWPRRWPRWSSGCPWCWSTSTPCPARPTGCSAGSPGPARSGGRAPRCPGRW